MPLLHTITDTYTLNIITLRFPFFFLPSTVCHNFCLFFMTFFNINSVWNILSNQAVLKKGLKKRATTTKTATGMWKFKSMSTVVNNSFLSLWLYILTIKLFKNVYVLQVSSPVCNNVNERARKRGKEIELVFWPQSPKVNTFSKLNAAQNFCWQHVNKYVSFSLSSV